MPCLLSNARSPHSQAEALGHLKLDPEMTRKLGMQGMTEALCKLSTASWVSKPVVVAEATMITMKVPIVQRSRTVHFYSTSPPGLRSRTVIRGCHNACAAPVDVYMARPEEMEGLSLKRWGWEMGPGGIIIGMDRHRGMHEQIRCLPLVTPPTPPPSCQSVTF